jgi:hypothetical protein
MSCREEVLEAAIAIATQMDDELFTPIEVIEYMRERGSRYPDSTIRNHVCSRLCVNAPVNHLSRYEYFERVLHGLYRVLPEAKREG